MERNSQGKLRKMGNAISIPKIDRILTSLDAIASSNCPPVDFFSAWFDQLAPLVNAVYGCTIVTTSKGQWAIQCRYSNSPGSHSIEQQILESDIIDWDDEKKISFQSGTSKESIAKWRSWSLSNTDSDSTRVLLFWVDDSQTQSSVESVLEGFLEIAQSYYHESTTIRVKRLLTDCQSVSEPIHRPLNGPQRNAVWISAIQSLTQSDRGVLLQCNGDGVYRCVAVSNAVDFTKGGVHGQYEKLALEFYSLPSPAAKRKSLMQFQQSRQLAAVQLISLPSSNDSIVLEWQNRSAFENSVDLIRWLLPVMAIARTENNQRKSPLWIRQNWVLCLFLSVLLGIVVLACTSTELYVEAEGTLQPQRHQVLFVPVDGFVKAWYVQDGQQVRAGDKLVDIQSPSLETHLQQLQHELLLTEEKKSGLNLLLAQLSTETTNETTATAGRLAGEVQELEQTKVNLLERIELARAENDRLRLVSQIDGVIITSSLELDRSVVPVRRGDAIVRVVDTHGPWYVEAHIEDDDIGVLPSMGELKKLEFDIVRNSGATEASFPGTLQHVASTLRPVHGRPVLVATFSTAWKQSDLRPGSSVHVYIPCGTARRWFIWTRPLLQAFQRRFWTL